MTMDHTTALARAALGAELLNQYGPERWYDEIDLLKLNVPSPFDCPLGQIYGSYSTGIQRLRWGGASLIDSFTYGFNCALADNEVLVQAWRNVVINARRAAAGDDAVLSPSQSARIELNPAVLTKLVKLSANLHDPDNPLAVVELDITGVRIALV